MFCSSAITVFHHVVFGRPGFLLPSGVHLIQSCMVEVYFMFIPGFPDVIKNFYTEDPVVANMHESEVEELR